MTATGVWDEQIEALATDVEIPAWVREEVRAGAQLLDSYDQDWFREVRAEFLDMASCKECVLGQLFGEYEEGKQELSQFTDPADKLQWAMDHGFTRDPDEETEWASLQAAWLLEIMERRHA